MDKLAEKTNGHKPADWEKQKAEERAALGERALAALLELAKVAHELLAHQPGTDDQE